MLLQSLALRLLGQRDIDGRGRQRSVAGRFLDGLGVRAAGNVMGCHCVAVCTVCV